MTQQGRQPAGHLQAKGDGQGLLGVGAPGHHCVAVAAGQLRQIPDQALLRRMTDAMQLPVEVPANGAPLTVALVTRPDGANVIVTVAVPDGSPNFRQRVASPAAFVSAADAAARSNAPEPEPSVRRFTAGAA